MSKVQLLRFRLIQSTRLAGFLLATLCVAALFSPGEPAIADEANSAASAVSPASAAPIYIDRLFLQPQANLNEPSTGGFGPLSLSAGLKTRFSNWVDVAVLFGSANLLYLPYWAPTNNQAFALLEAVGTVHLDYGDIYAGQFLVPWGLEGTTPEEALYFPRTFLYEKGYFPLRDVGAGFKTDSDGYYLNVAAHNGNGGGFNNSDNRVFVTGEFGYRGPAHSNFGFSLTEGRVGAPFLTPEQAVRGADAFFGFNIFGLGLQLEGSFLQTFSDAGNADVLAWHADLEHPLIDGMNLELRYEQLNPNTMASANVLGRGYVGVEIHSKNNVSRFFLFGIKNNESEQELPNDGILAQWRFVPPVD